MHKLIESLASTFKKSIQARTSCKVNLKILSALACQQNSHLIKASKDTSSGWTSRKTNFLQLSSQAKWIIMKIYDGENSEEFNTRRH